MRAAGRSGDHWRGRGVAGSGAFITAILAPLMGVALLGLLLLPRQSAGYIEVPMSLGYIIQ